jgi:hypothetical protein
VTGFTNGEEEAVHFTDVVPFLVEDKLKRIVAFTRRRRIGKALRLLTAVSSPVKIPRRRRPQLGRS